MTEPTEIREWLKKSIMICDVWPKILADSPIINWAKESKGMMKALLAMLDERERGGVSGEIKHIQEGFPKKGGQNQKPSSPRPITPPLGGGQGHANEEEKDGRTDD